ncbi:Rrf2 family transcriptional regulator [Jeotgalicoccus sp. S0W5]|uniref:Rrf2 family transcriptional regulator n=1 Tax=Jeotgalicoccus sp. S0W5 TaxID=2527874 RepID=UPI0014152561|nr:Rrf2 family transcriptional regulator [Jeotgalicoccus sp. S0W5]
MKISSRFTVGVHILTLIKIEREYTLSSTQIAESVNTNPVVIRRLMGKLKEAGLIEVSRGNTGAKLLKSLDEITLFDVYKAIEVVESGHLFQIHEDTNPKCTVGANIQMVLEVILESAQGAMEAVLKDVTLDNIVNKILVNNR